MAYQPKSYKKFVATAATATLVATAVAPTALAADFTDVNANYKNAVDYLVDQGIAQGFDETTFGTTSPIKRGDAAVMIAKALGLNTATAPDAGFTDLNARVAGAVNAIVAEGIASGKTSTTFAPDLYITRQEMAKIIANAYGLTGETVENTFTDVNDNWDEYVDALLAAGITFGYNETTFGATDDVTRGQFALFIYRAEGQPYDVATVESLTFNAEGDQFVLKFAEALPEDADLNYVLENYEVLVNGAAPSQATIDALKLSGTVSADRTAVTVSHTDLDDLASALGGTSVVLSIGGKSDTHVFDLEAEVTSVSAINANEVLVRTNTKLSEQSAEDETNYSVFINGAATSDTIVSAELQADGKSVIVRFATPVDNGQTLTVKTKDTLLTDKYAPLKSFTSAAVIFQDNTAPTLLNVSYNGTNVIATFSEQITSVANVRVDGLQATFGAAVDANEAGNYEYIITGAPVTAGDHSIVLTDVTDANGNVTGTQTSTYKIVADASAPSVSKVEALSDNSFKVTFSKPVASFSNTDNHLVIKKGANTIDNSRVTSTLAGDGKSVTFTITAADAQLPLYNAGESSVSLSLAFDNYKDANGLLGTPYASTVTLTKDASAPSILSKNLVKIDTTKTIITIPYTEAVDAVTAKNAEIVIKKDGIIQSGMTKPTVADVSTDTTEKTITLTFAAALTDGAYTFDLPTGLVKDKSLNNSVADSISVNVSSAASYIVPTVTDPIDNGNVIKVTAASDFTDSAKVLSNYKLDDAALPVGTTIDFVDNKKNVLITLPTNFPVVADANYKLEITSNVKTVDGSVVAANATTGGTFTKLVALNDNVAPELKSVAIVKDATDNTKFNTLSLTFSENLATVSNDAATQADFKVLVNGSAVAVNAVTDGTGGDKVVTLTVGNGTELFNASQTVTVSVVAVGTDNPAMNVTDIGLNKLKATGSAVVAQ